MNEREGEMKRGKGRSKVGNVLQLLWIWEEGGKRREKGSGKNEEGEWKVVG